MGILLACVVGGFLGGSIVYKVHPLFAYTDLPEIGLDASAELVQEHRDAAFQFRSWNYSADFAIIGSILGLSFGAFAGGSRRMPATIAGGLVGGLLGAGLGFLGGLYVAKTILLNAEQTLQESLGLQAAVWGLILAGIVWSVAATNLGVQSALTPGFVGLLAGLLVAMEHFVVGSFKFPTSNPLFLVPEGATERLYWLIAFPVVSGLILAIGLRSQKSARQPDEKVAAAA